jgi:hypothetical protein
MNHTMNHTQNKKKKDKEIKRSVRCNSRRRSLTAAPDMVRSDPLAVVGEAGYRTAPSAALNFAGLPVGGVSSSICAVPVMSADSGTHYRSG